MQTIIGVNDPKAVKAYAAAIFASLGVKSFCGKNMMKDCNAVGKTQQMANAPIGVVTDLESSAGDTVYFDVYAQLRGGATYGDDTLENNLESLTGYTDYVRINQVRKGVEAGAKMTQKRTLTNLRQQALIELEKFMMSHFDQVMITTLAGARGVSEDLYLPLGAAMPIPETKNYQAYDTEHIIYGGSASAKNNLTSTDKFGLGVVDRLLLQLDNYGGGASGKMRCAPLDMEGEDAYLLMISPSQEYDLRRESSSTNAAGWLEIQKAAAASNGYSNNIFKSTLGQYRGVHFRKHKDVVQFNDYGVGGNIPCHRAVLMGRQAAVVAFGSANDKKLKASWVEETKDMGNRLAVGASMMYGAARPEFNGQALNSYAVDTAVTAAS